MFKVWLTNYNNIYSSAGGKETPKSLLGHSSTQLQKHYSQQNNKQDKIITLSIQTLKKIRMCQFDKT